jgi:hypothetical protein
MFYDLNGFALCHSELSICGTPPADENAFSEQPQAK